MARDYSKYSVPELKDALDNVDGKRHPENKAALQRELRARQDAGEVDRLAREAREKWQRKERRSISFARKVRKVIAAFLVISPLASIVAFAVFADSEAVPGFVFVPYIVFLVASVAGGVGLFLDKAWGHWLAVTVLALQLLKIQAAGFAYSLLSVGGVFPYVAAGKVGVAALFEPGFVFIVQSELPLWIGVNVLFIPLIVYLFTAREEMP